MTEKNVGNIGESGVLSKIKPESKALNFSRGDKEWRERETAATAQAYWQEQLAGVPLNLPLPIARPRTQLPTSIQGQQFLVFSERINQDLRDFARSENSDLPLIFLAVFHTLLYRYSGQDFIVTAAELGGEGAASQPPDFRNIIPIRTNLEVVPTFRELLQTFAPAITEAERHYLPWAQMRQIIAPGDSELPLRLNFAYNQTTHLPDTFIGNNADSLIQEVPSKTDIDEFDLVLEIQVTPAAMQGCLSYNADLFDASTIEAMAGHFQTLLAAAVANPELNLNQLPMLTAAERQLMLE